MNEEQLKEHYLNYGRNEGRRYKYNLPNDFDVDDYKALNNDLKHMNKQQLMEHYLNLQRSHRNLKVAGGVRNTL